MIIDSADWIRVAAREEAHTDGGVWIWHPRVVMTPGDAATLQQLQSEGWERVDTAQHPALMELLQGQLAPLLAVQMPKAEKAEKWARTEDIRRALASPVVLAFGIPHELEDLHETGQAHIAQPIPPLWMGVYGLAVIAATSEDWSSTVYHYQGNDDKQMIARREQLRAALEDLAGAAQWLPTQTPFFDLCMEPGGYEHLSREVTENLLTAHTDEERALWHEWQTMLDYLVTQAGALKAQRAHVLSDPQWWEREWGRIHEMAAQLAESYWQTHQAATHPPRQLPQMANIFDEAGQVQVPSAHPLLVITQAQALGKTGAGWAVVGDYPTFHQRTEQHDTALQVRPADPDAVLDDTTIAGLWTQVNEMSDLDADILLAMIAQWMHTGEDVNGYVWITGEHILEYRGVQPIMKHEGGRERRAGHRQEDMIAVSRCVGRQQTQWVVIRSQVVGDAEGGKGRAKKRQLYTREARLTDVVETIRRHELLPLEERASAPSYGVAWRYRPGTWLTRFIKGPNRHMAWLCQQALRYDPYHEQWEKRLARYLMFHLRINAKGGGGSIPRGVGNLLAELDLSIDERNPQRTRARFEQAMNRLATDGQIEHWRYTDASPLPARGWLATWLERSIRITAAPLTQERYSSIAEHDRQRRERAPTLNAKHDAKGDAKGDKPSDA